MRRLWFGASVAAFAAVAAGSLSALATPSSAPASRASLAAWHSLLYPADQLFGEAQRASEEAAPGIVRSVGVHLVLDGQPWRFVGFDDYKLTSQLYSDGFTCGGEHSDAEVDQTLAQMSRMGVTVVRTWFFQSYVAGRGWAAFDRVLNLAGKYGIRVIPVLANQWGACEEYKQAAQVYRSIAWYQFGYRINREYGVALPYRDYALSVARHYAGDPRIAFWQLMNEAEALDFLGGRCDETQASRALRSFADDMSGALKSVDGAHLVSLGTLGGSQCGTVGPDFQFIHGGAVDICEYHDYQATPQLRGANRCLALGKPTFVGERGFASDVGTRQTTAQTLATRASYVKQDIESVFADDRCVGYLLWSWGSESTAYDVGPQDPIAQVLLADSRTITRPLAVYLTVWLAARAGTSTHAAQ